MADKTITRDIYKQYAKKITSILDGDNFYEQFKLRVDKGTSNFKLAKKRLIQDISLDWIATIEDVLPNLDTIVRNPRKFIVQEEDIVDVALARSISTESVKFLAQHTNMISKVDKDGSVTPSKILNISKEESFEIYENRFIYTLLLKLKDFVTMRYDKIKKATATQDVLELDLESRFNLPSKKITMRTEYFAQLSFDEVMRLDPETLSKVERIAKIDRIITDFLSSSFCKSMRNSAPVRPPIMRTNVILKEPNFKKALTLWQFVETYNVTAGFSTSDEVEDYDIENDSKNRLRELVTLNTMLFESLYDQCETDMDMEDKEFADFLRVGEMDFQKDNIDRDEYAQKLDEEVRDDDEDERIEEVKPQDDKDAETEIPPEEKPETPDEQQDETAEEQVQLGEGKDIPPSDIPEEKEVEKEVIKEVEHIIEVEKFKEMPPKDVENELDLEPDADKFDEHLFEVRKVFKRPDNDKLKQEETIKVKDAIDRCLNCYRKIKQDELDERDRQERIRRRKEDIEKRAAAFRKAKEDVAKGFKDESTTFFGVDPFAAQKAKIEAKKQEEKALKEAEKLKVNKNEHLDLDNADIEEVNKEFDENKKLEEEKAKKDAAIDKKLDKMNAIMPIFGDEALRTNRVVDIDEEKEEEVVESAPQVEVAPKEVKERKSGEIKIAKAVEAHDVFKETKKTKEPKVIIPGDISKSNVGGISIKEDDTIKPWGDGANLGNLEPKVEKPKKEKKPKEEKPVKEPKEPKEKKEKAPKPPKIKSTLIVQERVKGAVITDGMKFSSLDNPYGLTSDVKPWTDANLGKLEDLDSEDDDK